MTENDIGKVKCLNIQLYIKLHGIIDTDRELIQGAWRVCDVIRDAFDKDESLNKLGLQTVNPMVNYILIDKNERIEYIRCPRCLKSNVSEEYTLGSYDEQAYMECRECGYRWDDDGEYKRGKNNEEIRM